MRSYKVQFILASVVVHQRTPRGTVTLAPKLALLAACSRPQHGALGTPIVRLCRHTVVVAAEVRAPLVVIETNLELPDRVIRRVSVDFPLGQLFTHSRLRFPDCLSRSYVGGS